MPTPTRPTSKKPLAFGAAVVLAAGLLGFVSYRATAPDGTPSGTTAVSTTSEPDADMYAELAELARRDAGDKLAQGRTDAPVVLIEYADFKCGYCGKFARDTEPALIKKYVADGTLRIEWRNFPIFGKESEAAARASWAAARRGPFLGLPPGRVCRGRQGEGLRQGPAQGPRPAGRGQGPRPLRTRHRQQGRRGRGRQGPGTGVRNRRHVHPVLPHQRPPRGRSPADGRLHPGHRSGSGRGRQRGQRRGPREVTPGIGYFAALLGGLLALVSPCSALLLPAFFAYSLDSASRLLARTGIFYSKPRHHPGTARRRFYRTPDGSSTDTATPWSSARAG